MRAKQTVLASQLRWAQSRGLLPDARGYVGNCEMNLFRSLSPAARQCFKAGSGNELTDVGDRPAKMRALHSSSALVVNFFDRWIDQPDVVLAALDLPTGGVSMRFEAQFPTGLHGTPPNLDAAIKWADSTWLGIESKFTEWLTPKPVKKEVFKGKYFPESRALWGSRGHSRCEDLAAQIRDREVEYRYLDAPQLLKHALGLGCTGSKFELLYLYFDAPGVESVVHRAEIEDFAGRIAGDFSFHVRTYQDVFRRLTALAKPEDAEYLAYLRGRYFPGVFPSSCHARAASSWL